MSVKTIPTVTFELNFRNEICKLKSSLSSDKAQEIANIVRSALIKPSIEPTGTYTLKILEDYEIELRYNPLYTPAKTIPLSSSIDSDATERITTLFKEQFKDDEIENHCKWILNKTISKLKGTKEEKTTFIQRRKKDFVELKKNPIDFLFVQKIYQNKFADIVTVGLFLTIILGLAVALIAPQSIGLLHFALNTRHVLQPMFGVVTIGVGLGSTTQAIKNLIKAKKEKNKEDMILAILSLFYSLAIIATGSTALANFSNDSMLKALFTTCAGFSFIIGANNFRHTATFFRKLKNAKNLKEFLKDQIEITKEEYLAKDAMVKSTSKAKILEKLKNHFSKEEFKGIETSNLKTDNKQYLETIYLDVELQTLQKRKIAGLEKILRFKLANKAIDFLKCSEVKNEELEKEINKELLKRAIADGCRLIATSLSISAFVFNIKTDIVSENLKNLIYFSMMEVSKLTGSWQNYFKSWRNVPAEDKKDLIERKKSFLESINKREQGIKTMDPRAPVVAF